MKNRTVLFIVALLLIVGYSVSAQANAVTTAVALDRLDSTLSGIIENAASEANIVVFNAATEARLLLKQWRHENSALLNQAVSGANSVVSNSFNSMTAMVDRLEVGAVDARVATDSLLDSAQQLTETLTLSDRPVFRRVSPTYIIPEIEAPLDVSVAGINLDKLTHAELNFGDVKFLPTNPTQTSMLFSVPTQVSRSSQPGNGEVLSALVWTYPHTSWWRRTMGKTVTVSYPLRMLRLPEQLAEVTLSYAEVKSVRETREREEQFFHKRGGRYKSRTCASVPIRPYEGYKIDLSTVRTTYSTGAYGSFQMLNLTPEGFVGHSCAKSRSKSGYKDTKVAWTEYRELPSIGDRADRSKQPLRWTEDLVVRLPANAHAPELSIDVFDGRVFKVTGPGVHDFGFLRATYDTNSGSIAVRPLARQYRVE